MSEQAYHLAHLALLAFIAGSLVVRRSTGSRNSWRDLARDWQGDAHEWKALARDAACEHCGTKKPGHDETPR